jgi:hypothetical protein
MDCERWPSCTSATRKCSVRLPSGDVHAIYGASDGPATRALFSLLKRHGINGQLANALFRACKSSERAKVYRGGVRGRGSRDTKKLIAVAHFRTFHRRMTHEFVHRVDGDSILGMRRNSRAAAALE